MRLEYFQMIDRITGIDREAATITAESTVPTESPVLEGHFPGHPLMPGNLLVETMAQAAGLLVLDRLEWKRIPLLTGIRKAKLRQFVKPGSHLSVSAALVGDGQGYAVCTGRIAIDGGKIADAELSFVVTDFPSPIMRDAVRSWWDNAAVDLEPAV